VTGKWFISREFVVTWSAYAESLKLA